MPSREHLPVRDPEISELRAFCFAAELGSIAEAARVMHVSQPAMSKRLRVLEAVAGAELLTRSPRGVTLTPAGEQLYTAAQRVLASADAVNQLIQSRPSAVVAKIATSPTAAEQRLPAVLAFLAAELPAFAAEITTANSWVVRELVRDGRYELGVVAIDQYVPQGDDLHQRRLWRDEVVVAVPAEHPWRTLPEIPLDLFIREPLIERDPWAHSSRLVSVMLEHAGLARAAPRVQLGSTQAIIASARALETPALVSAGALAGQSAGLVIRRVDGLHFIRDFALVWAGGISALSASAQAVASHLTAGPRPDAYS